MESFSEKELQRLSDEVDTQLREIRTQVPTDLQKAITKSDRQQALDKQFAAIATATGEPPDSFLCKFARSARRDLCEEGGMLYEQWQTWADLTNKDTLNTYKAVLVSMGFTGEFIPMLVVALAVITLHLGAKTICEEYGQSEET
ncbi:MAG: hypothetical protein ACO3EZ_01780 [Prochlorotrichaceae cyanobacterium]